MKSLVHGLEVEEEREGKGSSCSSSSSSFIQLVPWPSASLFVVKRGPCWLLEHVAFLFWWAPSLLFFLSLPLPPSFLFTPIALFSLRLGIGCICSLVWCPINRREWREVHGAYVVCLLSLLTFHFNPLPRRMLLHMQTSDTNWTVDITQLNKTRQWTN